MSTEVKGFGSDNHAGVHPTLLQALLEANVGHAPSYGTDTWSSQLRQLIKSQFGEKAEGFLVFNGTAANVLCLKALVRDYETVLTAATSHLHMDECGAAEKLIGCKVVSIPSADGKLRAEDIEPFLIRKGDQHFSQVRAVSITQPTEYGTLYSLEEMRALADFAHAHDLFLHVDGSRFIYAAAALETDFKTLTQDAGVDALSFGGTKNGLLFGELCLFFQAEAAKNFKYIRKQGMQLPSKQRFAAAQFQRFLQPPGLWRQVAANGLQLAARLAAGLSEFPEIQVTQKTQANAVFARIPKAWVKPLREKHFFYVWDEHTFECRLMLSFDSTDHDVDSFLQTIQKIRSKA